MVRLLTILIFSALFALSACGTNSFGNGGPTGQPVATASPAGTATAGESATPAGSAELPPTPTPINLAAIDWSIANRPFGNPEDCAILTKTDIGGMFSGETNGPVHNSGPADRVTFAPEKVSAHESYCLILVYHNSGSVNFRFYQTTYWVDKPDQATPDQWTSVWTDGKSGDATSVEGIGDEAFFKDHRLTFKKGTTYVTVEVQSNKVDPTTPDGAAQQLDLEKQVALKALKRIG